MHVASKYVFIEMCLILRVASAVVKTPAAGASTLYGFTICNASPKRHPRELPMLGGVFGRVVERAF